MWLPHSPYPLCKKLFLLQFSVNVFTQNQPLFFCSCAYYYYYTYYYLGGGLNISGAMDGDAVLTLLYFHLSVFVLSLKEGKGRWGGYDLYGMDGYSEYTGIGWGNVLGIALSGISTSHDFCV